MRIVTLIVAGAALFAGVARAQTAALPEKYVKPVQAEELREMKLQQETQREEMRFAKLVDQARRELNLPEGARFDMQDMRFVAPPQPPQQQMPQVNVQQNVQQNNAAPPPPAPAPAPPAAAAPAPATPAPDAGKK